MTRNAQVLLTLTTLAVTGLVVGSPGAGASGLCDGAPYMVGNQPANFFAVTTDPAALLDLGELMLDGDHVEVNAVGIRSTDGLMYGWDDTNQQLVTVDAELTVSPLPPTSPPLPVGFREPDYIAGEISADGEAYYLFSLLDPDALFVVDLTMSPSSLTLSTVPLSERITLSDFALHPTSGLLYGERDQELVRIDPQSGEVVRSALGPASPQYLGSAWFDPSGALFGILNDNGMGQSELWRIDLQSLSATSQGTFPALVASDGAKCLAPPEGRKEGCGSALSSLLPTGDPEVDRAIRKARRYVRLSLRDDLWIDGWHLDCDRGRKVFDREKRAVRELLSLLAGDDGDSDSDSDSGSDSDSDSGGDSDSDGGLDPELEEALIDVVFCLISVDQELARVSLDDAIAAAAAAGCGADPDSRPCRKALRHIGRGEQEHEQATAEVADGDAEAAIFRFRKAWEWACKALATLFEG